MTHTILPLLTRDTRLVNFLVEVGQSVEKFQMGNLSINSIHRELIQNHVSNRSDSDELLLWMVLLHTHTMHLKTACLADAPGVTAIHPITQRSTAIVAADLWANRNDREKTSPEFWYRVYQIDSPWETMSSVPTDKAAKIGLLRQRLETEPLVKAVLPD